VRTLPMCKKPVGLGANLTRVLIVCAQNSRRFDARARSNRRTP
jgi:hypothetical protein